jgi:L-malate glycosyltransferase
VASELAIGLAQRGHEVHIVSSATPFRLGAFYENIYVHEVQAATYPLFKYPPYALSLATKLADVVQEYQLDLIHAHYAVPHAASAYLAKKILASERLRTITTLHGTDITLVGLDNSFYRVVKFAIDESDGVTAVSRYLRRRTVEEFKTRKEIRVVYNFVDTDKYRPNGRTCIRERFASPGERILFHASNFRPVKRVGDTVRILARLRERMPAKLLLVGEGPERLFVQQLVKELKLTDHVVFLGQQDYLNELLACADLMLLPSEQESFGLVALEAHSCGVPVIGTATGGLPEVVEDGRTGYLLPVGEIGAMCDRAAEILQDEERLSAFRIRARVLALEKFRMDLIIPEYESFYEEVLSG